VRPAPLALRQQAQRSLLLVLVVTGLACGGIAVLFHTVLSLTELGLRGPLREIRSPWLKGALVALLPGVISALLGSALARFRAGGPAGLALVRQAYAEAPHRLSLRSFVATFVATPLSLGAGVPLGPEGPTVALTSAAATGFARLLRLPARVVRGMIPVGTAAGIAAIFNTPITGVVFALEEVIGTASRGVLGGAIVAAVAAAVVQQQMLGGSHLLPASPGAWSSSWELPGFATLGLLCGSASGLLLRSADALRPRFEGVPPLRRGFAAGVAIGTLGLVSPDVLGVGYEVVSAWLHGGGDGPSALLAFLCKFAGVAIALGAGLWGGVFAPSLFLGAALGAAAGHGLQLLFPAGAIDPAAWALVGMGAFFAGFQRTPLASVLIVFELTGDYGLVLPLMLAVALSSLVSRRLAPQTLVEAQLGRAGVPSGETRDPHFERIV